VTTEGKPTVIEALSAVMADVQAIKKDDRNTQQNYSFRGIDAVVNAVGPALRAHGVVVVPIAVELASEHYTTGKGTQMKGVTLTVTFRFYGPAGDYIDATACGESSDSGDKAVPKAHSVAFRTLLLQALCIPTDEPDPDAESHERGEAPTPTPAPAPELPKDSNMASDAQKRRMWAMQKERGVTADELKELVYRLTSKRSSKDLTKVDIAAVFEALEAWKAPHDGDDGGEF
jgi:hypothetical protein